LTGVLYRRYSLAQSGSILRARAGSILRACFHHNPSSVDWAPSWSPDGSRIVFSSIREENDDATATDIYVMNADGTDPVNITNLRGWEFDPVWSPDGSKIVYFTIGPMYIASVDGSSRSALGFGKWPDWSPDGSRIVYSVDDDIIIVNVDGTGIFNFTNNPASSDVWPSWAPIIE